MTDERRCARAWQRHPCLRKDESLRVEVSQVLVAKGADFQQRTRSLYPPFSSLRVFRLLEPFVLSIGTLIFWVRDICRANRGASGSV